MQDNKESISVSNEQIGRIAYFDGIRGIASILVVFCHLACVFLPNLYFYENATSKFYRFFFNTPLNVLTNGEFAVQCFFVLSGFLIARKMYALKQNNAKPFSPVKTYFKFVKIVFPAILLAAFLMRVGLMFHLQAAELNSELDFVLGYNNFTPTFLSAFFTEPFYRVFVSGSNYVGPFWTIRYEFYGTFLISAISFFAANRTKNTKMFYIFCGLIFAFINPYLTSFVVGAFVFDCLERRNVDNSWIDKIFNYILSNKILIVLFGIAGIYFASTSLKLTGFWKPIKYFCTIIDVDPTIFRAFGIGQCLICVHEFSFLKTLLAAKPFKWLGKISAQIYAFHWPIILSVGCGLYLLLANKLTYSIIVLIISASVLAVTILFAFSYIKLVPLIDRLGKQIAEKIQSFIKAKKAKTKKN